MDEILQGYREFYPAISLKEVYMFFDEVQMADDWQPFVRRVYTNYYVFIFFYLTKYEPSLVKENTGDKKYYCIDNGLRSVLLNP